MIEIGYMNQYQVKEIKNFNFIPGSYRVKKFSGRREVGAEGVGDWDGSGQIQRNEIQFHSQLSS